MFLGCGINKLKSNSFFPKDSLFLGWGLKQVNDNNLRLWGIHSHNSTFGSAFGGRKIWNNNFKYYDSKAGCSECKKTFYVGYQ